MPLSISLNFIPVYNITILLTVKPSESNYLPGLEQIYYNICKALIVFLVIKSKFPNTMEKHCDSRNSNEDYLSIEIKSYQMSWEHCLETLKR